MASSPPPSLVARAAGGGAPVSVAEKTKDLDVDSLLTLEVANKLNIDDKQPKAAPRVRDDITPADFFTLQSIRSSELAKKTNTTSKLGRADRTALFDDLIHNPPPASVSESSAACKTTLQPGNQEAEIQVKEDDEDDVQQQGHKESKQSSTAAATTDECNSSEERTDAMVAGIGRMLHKLKVDEQATAKLKTESGSTAKDQSQQQQSATTSAAPKSQPPAEFIPRGPVRMPRSSAGTARSANMPYEMNWQQQQQHNNVQDMGYGGYEVGISTYWTDDCAPSSSGSPPQTFHAHQHLQHMQLQQQPHGYAYPHPQQVQFGAQPSPGDSYYPNSAGADTGYSSTSAASSVQMQSVGGCDHQLASPGAQTGSSSSSSLSTTAGAATTTAGAAATAPGEQLTAAELDRLLDSSELPDPLADFILKYSRRYSEDAVVATTSSAMTGVVCTPQAGGRKLPSPVGGERPASNESSSAGWQSPMSAGSAPHASPAAPLPGAALEQRSVIWPSANSCNGTQRSSSSTPSNQNNNNGSSSPVRTCKERLRQMIGDSEMDGAWAWIMRVGQQRSAEFPIYFRDEDGDTLLHIVVQHLDLAKVFALTEQMLKVTTARLFDMPNRHYETPLMLAVQRGSLEIVAYLLEAGADPTVCSARGERDSALGIAAARGFTAIVQTLCSHPSVELNQQNGRGLTPLLTAIRQHGCPADEASGRTIDNRAVVRALLDAGANPLATDATDGKTAIHLAVDALHADMIEIFRSALPDGTVGELINRPDKNGITPLQSLRALHGGRGGEGGVVSKGVQFEAQRQQVLLALLTCGAQMNATNSQQQQQQQQQQLNNQQAGVSAAIYGAAAMLNGPPAAEPAPGVGFYYHHQQQQQQQQQQPPQQQQQA